ncbi:hypothetical protein CMU25_19170 [Elizabethkingia anophelis]|nr:hypothetical protein [Elizabethkingia anophelis]MDV3842442.1 hypothetical protein [Elizabethkingia anophelis]
MLFYQGKGYLIYLIPICVFLLCAYLLREEEWWLYSCIITVILELIVSYFSFKEHQGNPYKYLDKETEQEIFIEHKNTVYWIKAEYWGVLISIVLILSVILM